MNGCLVNALTATSNPSDIAYLIDDDGSTASQTSYAYTTGSLGSNHCPLTREMQIWDDTSGDFIAFSSGTHSWGSAVNDPGNNRMYLTVDTESGTTLDGADVDSSIYHLRVKTYDPYSTESSAIVY